jgi:hypothetical protein
MAVLPGNHIDAPIIQQFRYSRMEISVGEQDTTVLIICIHKSINRYGGVVFGGTLGRKQCQVLFIWDG